MRALFAIRNDGADAYFRAIAPASILRFHGYEADARSIALEDADKYDALVLQRHCSPIAELAMRVFQEQGKPVIYDVDDWLGGIPPTWPAYDDYFQRGRFAPTSHLLMHERLLKRADVVTCTGPVLGEKLRTFNENVRIIPNCVMWRDWDIVIPVEKAVTGPIVGWFGMPYYWDSWRLLAEAIEQALYEIDGHLSVLGFPEVVCAFRERLRKRVLVQPMCRWRNFAGMRQMIASFDVGLAWLEDTPFNRCKSPLKALQYGAAGVPVVASPAPYSEVLKDEYPGQYGIIASTPEAVYQSIVNVIAHPEPAHRRTVAWREQVWRQHTYETQWHTWLSMLEEVTNET